MTAYRLRRCRHAATLLEVMVASALSALLVASAFVVVRSSHTAWLAHEQDMASAMSGAATLRHLVQNARQAVEVASITPATDDTGGLTVLYDDGRSHAWSLVGDRVELSIDGAAGQPVSAGIRALTFEGYEADGVTLTTAAEDVQSVRTIVEVDAPGGAGRRTLSSYFWVRSW